MLLIQGIGTSDSTSIAAQVSVILQKKVSKSGAEVEDSRSVQYPKLPTAFWHPLKKHVSERLD
jgi:hypothetical protein